jgi:hypothetical protein
MNPEFAGESLKFILAQVMHVVKLPDCLTTSLTYGMIRRVEIWFSAGSPMPNSGIDFFGAIRVSKHSLIYANPNGRTVQSWKGQ